MHERNITRMITLAPIIVATMFFLLVAFLVITAVPVFEKEGIGFITNSIWNYDTHEYGIFIFILGTIVLTAVTICIAFPSGIFTAIFLAEWAPAWLERIIRPLIELLVGIPSVVYGIFGLFVLEPFFKNQIDPFVSTYFGWIPCFHDNDTGNGLGILLASTVLAIMILPTIVSLSQESLKSVPLEYREASLAIGATRWETIRHVALPAAFPGILSALILGMMRAMGETMAVVMLTGNAPRVPTSVFDTGYAMTSKILNDIGYYVGMPEQRSALFGIAVVLLFIEICFVAAMRFVSDQMRRRT